jgi:hypothetical protein
MTPTGVTNLDILELSVPSIEAGEIHSGAAPAGYVLTADGAGGASWQAPNSGAGAIQGLIRYTWTVLASPDNEARTSAFVAAAGRQPLDGDGLIYFDNNEGGCILAVYFDGYWSRYYFW